MLQAAIKVMPSLELLNVADSCDTHVGLQAVHLVSQVLEEAYMIANAADESGQPWRYLSMLKNLRSGRLGDVDEDISFVASRGDSDGANENKLEQYCATVVTTSTPQKPADAPGSNTESSFIGQGDEDYDACQKELSKSTSVFINRLFDMSEVEKVVICDDTETFQSDSASNDLLTQAMTTIMESYVNNAFNIAFGQEFDDIEPLADDQFFASTDQYCYLYPSGAIHGNIGDDATFFIHGDLTYDNDDYNNNTEVSKMAGDTDVIEEVEKRNEIKDDNDDYNVQVSETIVNVAGDTNVIEFYKELEEHREIKEDNDNGDYSNNVEVSQMVVDIAGDTDIIEITKEVGQQDEIKDDNNVEISEIVAEVVDGRAVVEVTEEVEKQDESKDDNDDYNNVEVLQVVAEVVQYTEIIKVAEEVEKQDEIKDDNVGKIDVTFYENTYLTLNRDYEQQCSDEEGEPIMQDPKGIMMQEVELLTANSSIELTTQGDSIKDEGKELAAVSGVSGVSSRKSRNSIMSRCRSQGARLLACLRGWWRRKTPGKRREGKPRGTMRGICPLSPDARRRASSLLNDRNLSSPAPSRPMVWKYNTVNETLVNSNRWKEYTFEIKPEDCD